MELDYMDLRQSFGLPNITLKYMLAKPIFNHTKLMRVQKRF